MRAITHTHIHSLPFSSLSLSVTFYSFTHFCRGTNACPTEADRAAIRRDTEAELGLLRHHVRGAGQDGPAAVRPQEGHLRHQGGRLRRAQGGAVATDLLIVLILLAHTYLSIKG